MARRNPNPQPKSLLDYAHLEGGLARMMNRFRDEGTLTGKPDADEYLRTNPDAALLGLLYDQRMLAEYAFMAPAKLEARLGHLDLAKIAGMDEQALRDVFAERPAVHRFTNKMADYTRAVATKLVADWGGTAETLWNDGAEFETIRKRVESLPGFGREKAEKMRYVLHYFGWRDFS